MNDPQRPILLDGVWHYYYLYNAGYPKENGTEWYHLTSTDLVHWKEEGVAITKYKNGLGDIETGSAVVDHDNSAGFGKGAVIAVMTQQDQGIQRQTEFDVESFIQASGRKLSRNEREQMSQAVLKGMRWTYLGTGMTHPNFLDTVQSIKPEARAQIEQMAPAFC